ncbi:unnamed protein product [Candidula unifasciata]|uniref:Ig-like domain-containing protein n=1 Tax=Candidula unifasciata TaxID=100452 RepID=A0A8S3Z9T0_9EUPU|nr:unnamed protein product [Candidula unifasciata]
MAKLEICTGLLVFLVMFLAGLSSQTHGLTIDPNVRQLVVVEGSRQTLDCYVTVEQPISPKLINWTGPPNANFETHTETDNKLTYHTVLTINSFEERYAGTYTCAFYASDGKREAAISLVTTIEDKIEGEFFFGNKSAILQCTLSFTDLELKATFKEWLKDNVSVSHLINHEQFHDQGNGTLIISNPKRSDSGLYIAHYEVAGKDLESTHDCEVVYSAAPLVLDMAKSKNVIEGDTLHLECLVKGYPPANITWLKNDDIIVVNRSQMDRGRIITEPYNNFNDARLIIKSTTDADAGNYTCLATDRNGRTSAKFIRVRVKDRLEWLWPVVGILCEAVALAIVIFACSKIKKDDVDKPADEREGLLRQGSARNRDQDKHD